MKSNLLFMLALAFVSCRSANTPDQKTSDQPLIGTWQLLSNKIVTKGDTVLAFPANGKTEVMIKIFNGTHFAFFNHDSSKGKVKAPLYDSGAGTYTLNGSNYAEHLEYCNYRDWENRDFKFKLSIREDTLTQHGFEKIDSLNVDREIIETYIRLKP